MPDGNYFVRVNGTVTSGDSTTPLSTASGSSTAFDIFTGGPSDSTCLENTWTPIRSVEDPNYKPIRVILPTLGSLTGSTQQSVFAQADISGTTGIIEFQVPKVDQLFDVRVPRSLPSHCHYGLIMPTLPVHIPRPYDGGSNQHRNGVQRWGPRACKDCLFAPCPTPITLGLQF
jgi:hypothetical protein